MCYLHGPTCRLTTAVCRHSILLSQAGAIGAGGSSCALCLRLQRGCGVRAWGADGLGTGAQGRGREGAEGVDVDYALKQGEVKRSVVVYP